MARDGPGGRPDVTTARDPSFVAGLRAAIRGTVREAEPLARHSTYRIGGPATVLMPESAEDVAMALRQATSAGVPWFALGLGSNLLFPDAGLDALVVRMGRGLDRLVQDGDRWTLGAGLPAPLAAKRTASAGWGGIHKMVGVPGTVGGGVVMNAGCHGVEWRDTVESILVVDAAGMDRVVPAAEAGFGYRRSDLGHVVVLETTVALQSADPARLEEETEALYRWRRDGTPFNQPCCGSVFRNPVLPADWPEGHPRTSGQCIEATGLKGFRIGAVEVSPMHANYFVNTGGGTAADVTALIAEVQRRVAERWGVTLVPEVKVLGPDGTV
ncbi:MAG: UDP-N-acetylmuramate dehydrogenase [Gemmatimonadales bacterium]|nr:UDP-N-acetylmuramate dehydrogenase [Gemmatimonadales bacterium]